MPSGVLIHSCRGRALKSLIMLRLESVYLLLLINILMFKKVDEIIPAVFAVCQGDRMIITIVYNVQYTWPFAL